jgi:hypothetical protein
VHGARALTLEVDSSLTDLGTGVTVDTWAFEATADGDVTVDIRSFMVETSFIDSEIWVLRDDGFLSGDDLIASNDDAAAGEGSADGSVSTLDSFLSVNLSAGSYLVAVSTSGPSDIDDVLSGVTPTSVPLTLDGALVGAESGRYHLTVDGEVTGLTSPPTPNPEPDATLLFGFGGLAVSFAVRRRARA